MNIAPYCAQLRNLVSAYLAEGISRVEYLARRRELLDCIDRKCNRPCSEQDWTQESPDSDTTRPVHPKPCSN